MEGKKPDETPKTKVAKKVATPKRRYFIPVHGIEVVAENLDQALSQVKTKQQKAGDE